MREDRRKKVRQNKQRALIVTGCASAVLVLFSAFLPKPGSDSKLQDQTEPVSAAPTEAATEEQKPYMIQNVKVIPQEDLKAGCETYACTMLLNILGFDVDEYTIADNYLNCKYVITGDEGEKYGPDMYSAFAGTAYAGWGVYAPSMAKSMNQYLKDQNSSLHAYNSENIPLESLCSEYVSHGVPVMVWATTDMEEPYVFDTWTVNYVDENARTKEGDTFSWYMHEHCLVLIGYDSKSYYFADSSAKKISVFDKELTDKRYKQMGSQSIVVK